MGKFIITRTALGDRFVLLSDSGRTLVTSRPYATLDACKKGIASLVLNAPLMPVVDATLGEYGPNPKFEILGAEGGLFFGVKSPNGKTVITSPVYATKKACLRAISMLRTGVLDFEILLYNKAHYTPIVMKSLEGITPTAVPDGELPVEEPIEVITDMPSDVSDAPAPVPEAPDTPPAPVATEHTITPAPSRAAGVPRLIRLQPTAPSREKPTAQKMEGERTVGGIFGRFFKK